MAPETDQHDTYSLQTDNRHLKEMIAALRDEMEKLRIGEQEHIQDVVLAANVEIDQLKEMVSALRDELDRRQIEYNEKCREIERIANEDAKQLQEMIRALRDRLEEHGKR